MTSPSKADQLSYYITLIESNLKALGLNPDAEESYNACFDEIETADLLRRLRAYHSKVCNMIDAKYSGKAL